MNRDIDSQWAATTGKLNELKSALTYFPLQHAFSAEIFFLYCRNGKGGGSPQDLRNGFAYEGRNDSKPRVHCGNQKGFILQCRTPYQRMPVGTRVLIRDEFKKGYPQVV
jgi:hypothetical protein